MSPNVSNNISKSSEVVAPASESSEKAALTKRHHFRTDHLMGDLEGRAVRGGAITVFAQAVKFILQMGSTMILARLLTPIDFGLIAMVSAFTGLVSLFKDLGLSMATVQRAELKHAQVSTLFWINVALSIVLMGFSVVLAPAVAWFYGEPKLQLITVAIGCTFIFGGLSAQHMALLRRQMRFMALAAVEIIGMLGGIITAVTLAWFDAGYWALVAMWGMKEVITAVSCWHLSEWRPGKPLYDNDTVEMLKFGGNLTGFNVLNYFRTNVDTLLIGAKWGANSLGIYAKAYSLVLMPLQQLVNPLSAVITPTLSRLQKMPDQYRRNFCRATEMSLYLTMPPVVLLIVLPEEIVLIFLGGQWIEAGIILRIFGFFGLAQTLAATTGWVLISLGQANRMLKWQIFQSFYMVTAFIIGLPWGASGVAMAATVATMISLIPYLIFAFRKSPVKVQDFIFAVWRPAAVNTILLIVSVLTIRFVSTLPPVLVLASVLGAWAIVLAIILAAWDTVRFDIKNTISVLRRKHHEDV